MTNLSMLGAIALLLLSILLIVIVLQRENGPRRSHGGGRRARRLRNRGLPAGGGGERPDRVFDVAIGFALVAFVATVGWAYALAATAEDAP